TQAHSRQRGLRQHNRVPLGPPGQALVSHAVQIFEGYWGLVVPPVCHVRPLTLETAHHLGDVGLREAKLSGPDSLAKWWAGRWTVPWPCGSPSERWSKPSSADSRNPAWCITRIAGCNTLGRNI